MMKSGAIINLNWTNTICLDLTHILSAYTPTCSVDSIKVTIYGGRHTLDRNHDYCFQATSSYLVPPLNWSYSMRSALCGMALLYITSHNPKARGKPLHILSSLPTTKPTYESFVIAWSPTKAFPLRWNPNSTLHKTPDGQQSNLSVEPCKLPYIYGML